MKKRAVIMTALLCTLSLTGCKGGPAGLADKIQEQLPGNNARTYAEAESDGIAENDNKDTDSSISLDGRITKDFGSYEVPEDWEENAAHSSSDKFFYVEAGHGDDAQPDNISINIGDSNYAEDDYMTFKDAILSQLMMQMQGSDAQVNGEGTYTDSGDILLIYTITETDCITKQYYIVGDYEYCLVHLTVYSGDETEGVKAAETMVNSFQWAE